MYTMLMFTCHRNVTTIMPSDAKKPPTRASSLVFLIGPTLEEIPGSQLPTKRQVLQHYFYLKQQSKSENGWFRSDKVANETIVAVESFWLKACIKTLHRKNSLKLLDNLEKTHRKLLRNAKKSCPSEVQKRELFTENIDTLFDIGIYMFIGLFINGVVMIKAFPLLIM